MSVFQGLLDGNIWQPATLGSRPLLTGADDGVADGAALGVIAPMPADGVVPPPPPHAQSSSIAMETPVRRRVEWRTSSRCTAPAVRPARCSTV